MTEDLVDLNRKISESITDPYVALCAAVVLGAITECKAQPGRSTWAKANRDLAKAKREAIDFLQKDVDFWVDIAGLKIDPDHIRQVLAPEFAKREEMTKIIEENSKPYTKNRKRRRCRKKISILNCASPAT